MADRETVIKGLKKCRRCECDDCTEKGASQAPWDCPVYDDFIDSAIALLKEQEKRINELEEKLRLLEYSDQDILQSGMMPAT